MKKILSAILASTMVLTFTACGSSETSTTTPTVTEDGKTVITAWAWDANFNVAALEVAKDVFAKEYPDSNIEIEIVEYAQADIVQKLNTGLSSGSSSGLPNIVLIEDYRIQSFLQAYPGNFADMSSITNPDIFAEHKISVMQDGDAIYGIPFDNSSAVLYYRRDMIEAAGYTDDDMMNLTWEEYLLMGDKIKETSGVDLLTLDPNDIGQIRMMLQSANTWYTTPDGNAPNFQDPAMKYAVEMYVSLLQSGNAKIISEWSQYVGAPNNGEVATVPTGCWFTPSIVQADDQAGLWGVAPFPTLSGANGTNASNLGGSSFYVLSNVPGVEEAQEFLSKTFAASDDLYETILENNNVVATYLPTQSGAAYSASLDFFNGQAVYSDISKWSENIPAINYGMHTYVCEDILKAEVQNIINGMDVDTALANAQSQAQAQFN